MEVNVGVPYAGNPESYPDAVDVLSPPDIPNAATFDTAFRKNVSGVWSTPGAGDLANVTQLTDVQIASFGGYVIEAIGSSGPNLTVLLSSNDGFQTATEQGTSGVPVPYWRLRASSKVLLAVPIFEPQASPFLMATTDGKTWATLPLQDPSLVAAAAANGATWAEYGSEILATDVIAGIDFGQDSGGPCWLMTVQNPHGGTKVLRSEDGLHYSLVSVLTATIGDIAAPKGYVRDPSTGAVVQTARTLYAVADDGGDHIVVSRDGGATWNQAPSVALEAQALVSGDLQALAFSASQVLTSMSAGFGQPVT